MAIGITLTVLPDTEPDATKVVEVLSRAAAGLAFDGLSVALSLGTYDEDES